MAEQLVKIIIKKGVCKVEPGRCIAHRGDTVVFQAVNTCGKITFPEAQPFGRLRPHKKVNARRRNKEWSLPVPLDAIPGEYEYTVYCEDTRRYAVAGSEPKMIIDP